MQQYICMFGGGTCSAYLFVCFFDAFFINMTTSLDLLGKGWWALECDALICRNDLGRQMEKPQTEQLEEEGGFEKHFRRDPPWFSKE